MADQVEEVKMSKTDQMESARNVLSTAAVRFMARGAVPDSGTGTIVSDDKGAQQIVGINDGFSRINWSEKASKTQSADGTVITETSDFGDSKVVHVQTKDPANPKSYKDEIKQILGDGQVRIDMSGQCNEDTNGQQKCTYDLKSTWGDGTAEITTSKRDINKQYEVWEADSHYNVKTQNGEVDLALKYKVSGEVAAYEYKNVSAKP